MTGTRKKQLAIICLVLSALMVVVLLVIPVANTLYLILKHGERYYIGDGDEEVGALASYLQDELWHRGLKTGVWYESSWRGHTHKLLVLGLSERKDVDLAMELLLKLRKEKQVKWRLIVEFYEVDARTAPEVIGKKPFYVVNLEAQSLESSSK